jgi:glutaminase
MSKSIDSKADTVRRHGVFGALRIAAVSLMVVMTGSAFTSPVMARAAQTQAALSDSEIQTALNNAYAQVKDVKEGKNADYIPALAKVDSNIFGIALITADGRVFTVGDVKSEVSIQSISKVFTMAKVMEEQSPKAIQDRIGTDATGMRFNSIVSIEQSQKQLGGHGEMNALVNPGAITATSMVAGADRAAIWNSIISYYSEFAGRPLSVNQEVFKSESDSNQRNQAIGALMYAYEFIKSDWPRAVDIYTEQCSVNVNARDLATMAATLANAGLNPVTGKQVMKAEDVPEVLAVMATAGLYDDSGKWLYKTGLPGKSGVGGGIIAVSPGRFGIAVISPPLDDAGNSVKAQLAIAAVSNALGGNPYEVAPVAKKR